MTKRRPGKRSKTVVVLLTVQEHSLLTEQFRATQYRHLAEYARDKLFSRPITVKVRDVTADEFLVMAAAMKSELEHYRHLLTESLRLTTKDNQMTPAMALYHISSFKDQIAIIGRSMHDLHQRLLST